MLQESCILVYNLVVMGPNCARIYKSRENWGKGVFDKNKAIIDLEHRLGLALSTT